MGRKGDGETAVTAAMKIVRHLAGVVIDSGRLDLAGEAFRRTNARLFLRFQRVPVKKRTVNKLAGRRGRVRCGPSSD